MAVTEFELKSRAMFSELSTAALSEMLDAQVNVPDSEKLLHKDFQLYDLWMRQELASREGLHSEGGFVRFYRAHPFLPGTVKFAVPNVSDFGEEWLGSELLARFNQGRVKQDRPTTADIIDAHGKQLLKLFVGDDSHVFSSPTDRVEP